MNFNGDHTNEIIGCAIEVHRNMGSGYPESDYHRAFVYELKEKGLNIKSEYCTDFKYKGIKLRKKRIDIVVEDKVIVELKVGLYHKKAHTAQILSYMRITNLKIGLIIYFNSDQVKIKRIVL